MANSRRVSFPLQTSSTSIRFRTIHMEEMMMVVVLMVLMMMMEEEENWEEVVMVGISS